MIILIGYKMNLNESGKRSSEFSFDTDLFAERVRSLRKEKGWKLEDLSDKSGISVSSLSKIENGTNPRFDTVVKIARALGISVDYLAGNSNISSFEISKELGLSIESVDNLRMRHNTPNGDGDLKSREDDYIPPIFIGFAPEERAVKEFIRQSHMLDVIAKCNGEEEIHSNISAKGLEIYNRYRTDEGSRILYETFVGKRLTEKYLNDADLYILDKIILNWDLIRMMSKYIRSYGALDVVGLVKIEETDLFTERKLTEYLQSFRKSLRDDALFSVPKFSEGDVNSMNNMRARIDPKRYEEIDEEGIDDELKDMTNEIINM